MLACACALGAQFFQPEGDHLTLLTVYQSWAHNKFSQSWCHENFVQYRQMRKADDVRKQLKSIMVREMIGRPRLSFCVREWSSSRN